MEISDPILRPQNAIVEASLRANEPTASQPNGESQADIALMVAWMSGIAFNRLVGKRPELMNDPVKAKAEGPFLILVADVFKALEIETCPEANATTAVDAINKNKHPITGGYSPFPA